MRLICEPRQTISPVFSRVILNCIRHQGAPSQSLGRIYLCKGVGGSLIPHETSACTNGPNTCSRTVPSQVGAAEDRVAYLLAAHWSEWPSVEGRLRKCRAHSKYDRTSTYTTEKGHRDRLGIAQWPSGLNVAAVKRGRVVGTVGCSAILGASPTASLLPPQGWLARAFSGTTKGSASNGPAPRRQCRGRDACSIAGWALTCKTYIAGVR